MKLLLDLGHRLLIPCLLQRGLLFIRVDLLLCTAALRAILEDMGAGALLVYDDQNDAILTAVVR